MVQPSRRNRMIRIGDRERSVGDILDEFFAAKRWLSWMIKLWPLDGKMELIDRHDPSCLFGGKVCMAPCTRDESLFLEELVQSGVLESIPFLGVCKILRATVWKNDQADTIVERLFGSVTDSDGERDWSTTSFRSSIHELYDMSKPSHLTNSLPFPTKSFV
jgi:hypothetical protein